MSATFGKFVLPSLLASGAVFTALSLPLAVYADAPVELQLTEEIGVSGVLKDLSAPYLGLSGLIGLAVGGVGLTLMGVGHSKKQSVLLQQQTQASYEASQKRDADIQAILTSGKGLSGSGLDFFLDDVISTVVPLVETAAEGASVVVTPAVMLSTPQPVSFSVNGTIAGIQPVKVPQVTVQTSISPMPAAHGFLGFVRSGQAIPSAAITWLEEVESNPQVAQLQSLQDQLQSLTSQIEQLQSAIQAHTAPVSQIEIITQSETPKNNVTTRRFQPFEHSWAGAPQLVAS